MKSKIRSLLVGVIITLSTAFVGAYILVTLRGFPTPWLYHSKSNFAALLAITSVFLFGFNTTAQLLMYFWYKKSWPNKPYYIQKLFPRPLVFFFSFVLLIFINFVMGLSGETLWSSGYMEVEFVSFLLYFGAFILLTIQLPLSNPWEVLIRPRAYAVEEQEQVIVLQHKQETLLLPISTLPVLVFMRKLCLCVCMEGRQLQAQKWNSEIFKKTPEFKDYIRVNRNTFVREETVEGYISKGRSKYVLFKKEVQGKIDGIIRDGEPHIRGKNEKESLTEDTFKISETYMPQVRDVLEKRVKRTA